MSGWLQKVISSGGNDRACCRQSAHYSQHQISGEKVAVDSFSQWTMLHRTKKRFSRLAFISAGFDDRHSNKCAEQNFPGFHPEILRNNVSQQGLPRVGSGRTGERECAFELRFV